MFFADETTTGENPALRGYARVVIAARWPDEESAEWITEVTRALPADAGAPTEAKSRLLLELCESDAALRRLVHGRVFVAAIFIADPFAHLRGLLDRVARGLNLKLDPQRELLAFLRKGKSTQGFAEKILEFGRRGSLISGPIAQVEALLGRAINTLGLHSSPKQLFDRDELIGLSDHDFRELVARFSVSLGDVFDPSKRMSAALEESDGHRFIRPGAVAWRTFAEVVGPDYIFDHGSKRAFERLEQAHQLVIDALDAAMMFDAQLKGGGIREEDSARLLGLQAADIAAGMARRFFESGFADVESAADKVPVHFDRVLLNDRWL